MVHLLLHPLQPVTPRLHRENRCTLPSLLPQRPELWWTGASGWTALYTGMQKLQISPVRCLKATFSSFQTVKWNTVGGKHEMEELHRKTCPYYLVPYVFLPSQSSCWAPRNLEFRRDGDVAQVFFVETHNVPGDVFTSAFQIIQDLRIQPSVILQVYSGETYSSSAWIRPGSAWTVCLSVRCFWVLLLLLLQENPSLCVFNVR